MDEQLYPYMAYVLRLWCEGPNSPWRATLECARTGERYPFADLATLFAFLEAETQNARPLLVSFEDTRHGGKSQTEAG